MLRRLFYIFIFTLQIVSCSSQSVIVPFKCNSKGQIQVTLQINGKSVTGIFDTGAPISSIQLKDSENIGMTLSDKNIGVVYPAIVKESFFLPIYNSTYIKIGGLKTLKGISFTKAPEIFDQTIIGMDIINQFCWLFDFKTMQLTLSKNPLNFNTKNSIRIPYIFDEFNMICSINIGNKVQLNNTESNSVIILEHILIDTGAHNTAVVKGDTVSNVLTISNITSQGKFMYNGVDIEELIIIPRQKKYDMFSKRADSNIPYFSGYINISADYQWYTKFNFDGILTFGKQSNYSQIYFDTKNQIIYLKK